MGQMKPGRKPDPPLDPGRYSWPGRMHRNFGIREDRVFAEISWKFRVRFLEGEEGEKEGQVPKIKEMKIRIVSG